MIVMARHGVPASGPPRLRARLRANESVSSAAAPRSGAEIRLVISSGSARFKPGWPALRRAMTGFVQRTALHPLRHLDTEEVEHLYKHTQRQLAQTEACGAQTCIRFRQNMVRRIKAAEYRRDRE